jgi:hypothetical protein
MIIKKNVEINATIEPCCSFLIAVKLISIVVIIKNNSP